jgi:hypothetical protein
MTELPCPITLRSLTCGDATTGAIAAGMLSRLPTGGMAQRRLSDRFPLTGATWRLLDSRILAGAVDLLELDVAISLVSWLARYEAVAAAAQSTLTDPEQPEAMVTLLPPRPMTVGQGLGVTVCVDQHEVETITFRLEVSAEVGETSVVVRRGELAEVACDALTVSGSLLLGGWSTPLWQPEPVLLRTLHLTVDPPVVVPLLPVPRVGEPTAAGLQ